MKLVILFKDGTFLTLYEIQSVSLTGLDIIETTTFGNSPVKQRNVLDFYLTLDRG